MPASLLSLERLSFSEKEGKVLYRYGKEVQEQERMDYLEFIARGREVCPISGAFRLVGVLPPALHYVELNLTPLSIASDYSPRGEEPK